MENLRKQLEDLQLVLYNKDSEIQQLKESAARTQPHTEHNGTAGRETEVMMMIIILCSTFSLISKYM